MKITIEVTPSEIEEWGMMDEELYEAVPHIIRHIMGGFKEEPTQALDIDVDAISKSVEMGA